MPRAKIIDSNYYDFMAVLRRATAAGACIEKSDARWAEYVKAHGINEIAAFAIARQKLEQPTPVIIAEGGESDGLYFYSRNEEACLRLQTLAE
jgi:hypothetical protein